MPFNETWIWQMIYLNLIMLQYVFLLNGQYALKKNVNICVMPCSCWDCVFYTASLNLI